MATPLSSTTTAQTPSSPENASRRFSDDYNTFLTLLTTQLKHQNPIDPLDTHQFIAQIGQFSSVEQQIKSNQNLESLLKVIQSQNANNVIGYLGRTVTTSGKAASLAATGATEWHYSAPAPIQNATITIKNASGNAVFTETRALAAGSGTYTWDGQTSTGGRAPAGTYTISISGKDASGTKVDITTEHTGIVTELDLKGKEPVLLIGALRVPMSEVLRVR